MESAKQLIRDCEDALQRYINYSQNETGIVMPIQDLPLVGEPGFPPNKLAGDGSANLPQTAETCPRPVLVSQLPQQPALQPVGGATKDEIEQLKQSLLSESDVKKTGIKIDTSGAQQTKPTLASITMVGGQCSAPPDVAIPPAKSDNTKQSSTIKKPLTELMKMVEPKVQLDTEFTNIECEKFKEKYPTIINFYASWCGYSKKFLPVWKEFEKAFKCKKINVVAIECTDKKDFCQNFNIVAYPTVKLFVNDTVIDYDKERTIEALSEFVKKHVGVTK